MTRLKMFCVAVSLSLIAGLPEVSVAQNPSSGVVTASAPVFLYPDAARTPLTTLAKGTTVRIIQRQGDWYRIEFRDAQFGNRIGYVRADAVTLQPAVNPPSPSQSKTPPPIAGRRPPPRRAPSKPRLPVTASLNAGLQTTSRDFDATSTFEKSVESGTLNTRYGSDSPYSIDMGVQAGVWKALSVGVAATYASKAQAGEVTAEVPHPFFFNRPRSVSGVTPDLRRQEIAVHLDAAWTVPATRRTHVAIFAGPSYFQVKQGLVTDVAVTETYPYDTASFLSATTVEVTGKRWGYNVGVDVAQGVWKYVGVGFIARYSRASLTLPIVQDQEVSADVGGLQASAGLRLRW